MQYAPDFPTSNGQIIHSPEYLKLDIFFTNAFYKTVSEYLEKERYLTQSYDKYPFANRRLQKQSHDITMSPQIQLHNDCELT